MRFSRSAFAAAVPCLALAFASPALAENWGQWRGPLGNGVSAETGIPTKWSATENVLWKVPLPGPAGATPVVWGDRIFLTAADGDSLILSCVSTDGKPLWTQVVGHGNKTARDDEGNSASPSPCTDGKYVWSFMGTGDLACYTVDGVEVWKKNVQDAYGKFDIQFGMSSTPVLHEGVLYLQLIHGDGNPKTREARVVALKGETGAEVWAVERPSDAKNECEHSYASPILYQDPERQYLVTHGADYVVGHSLVDGTEIFRCGNLNPERSYNPTLRLVASPAAAPGLIVVPSAKHGPIFGLKGDLMGDVTKDESAYRWKLEDTPDVPSPLIVDGIVYLCRENGVVVALDAESGEVFYEERTQDDRHRASPVYADGHVYVTARKGMVTVLKAGKEFEIVSENQMGEPLSASPVISNGRIYLRTFDTLFAIGTK